MKVGTHVSVPHPVREGYSIKGTVVQVDKTYWPPTYVVNDALGRVRRFKSSEMSIDLTRRP